MIKYLYLTVMGQIYQRVQNCVLTKDWAAAEGRRLNCISYVLPILPNLFRSRSSCQSGSRSLVLYIPKMRIWVFWWSANLWCTLRWLVNFESSCRTPSNDTLWTKRNLKRPLTRGRRPRMRCKSASRIPSSKSSLSCQNRTIRPRPKGKPSSMLSTKQWIANG